MKHPVAAALLVLLLAGTARAQSLTSDQIRRIDSVFAPFDGTNRPGCSLGVGIAGTTIYVRGYGMSDLEHGVPITPTSIFHVASVSKQFTAFAVALLAQDGKLSVDDEVRKYIPELPDYGKKITIRHLMYHTSGIRDQWELLGMAGWRYPDDLFTQQDVFDIVTRQKELNFSPGDEYAYSNSGYTLLAMIVQRVSGKTLREFLNERVFVPLGMTSTHVHDDHAMIVPGRTSAYEGGPGKWKKSVPDFDTHGATSLFTTPADLLKWQAQLRRDDRRLCGALQGCAHLGGAEQRKPTNYGFGIALEKYRGTEAYGHGGADGGYRADVSRFPAHHLDISVTCNFAEATPNVYSRTVADIILEGKLEPPVAASKPATVAVSAARIGQLTGIYKAGHQRRRLEPDEQGRQAVHRALRRDARAHRCEPFHRLRHAGGVHRPCRRAGPRHEDRRHRRLDGQDAAVQADGGAVGGVRRRLLERRAARLVSRRDEGLGAGDPPVQAGAGKAHASICGRLRRRKCRYRAFRAHQGPSDRISTHGRARPERRIPEGS